MPDPSTTRLALYKSKSDGSELVNYTQDLGQNWDKVDAAAGFQIVTSTTRPSSPYSGKPIAQSDTSYSTFFSNGTAPASASWVEIPNSSSTFGSNLKLASGAQLVIGADTNLYRSAANILKTDDAFVAAGNVTVGGDLKLVNGGTTYRNKLSASTTVANTTSETVMAVMTIPANDAVAGAVYRIKAWGTASVTGTPTLTLRSRLGGVAGTALGSSGARTASSGVTNRSWQVTVDLVCLTTGVSGTWFASQITYEAVSLAAAAPFASPGLILDGTAAATADSTISEDLVLTATWSAASASNTLTCRGYSAERVA
ncbi:hypothetical protein ACFXKY_08060 [Streptomyces canus]|uniref:hypothetical protein n=1 Tax=Streptomyces canus TaxID=58343 RepID=UPI0036B32B2B